MKNIEKPVLRLTSKSIIHSFQNSGKRHLILTGSRGIGKSTLLKEIIDSAPILKNTPYITTHGYPKDHVEIIDNATNNKAVIGIYSDNTMNLVEAGFTDVGLPAIKNAIMSKSSYTIIDELGFLENDCQTFQHAVFELFEKKNVIAVLRKQSTPFLDTLRKRNDIFLYDLDNPVLSVGCVIMASGKGKRFGSNKLMASWNNEPLISNILNITGHNLFADRIVVTRNKDTYNYCNANNVPVLLHDKPNRNDTVFLGLSKLINNNPNLYGCMFTVSDQPLLCRESLESIVLSFSNINKKNAIVSLGNNGNIGNPVLFGRDYYNDLLSLPEKKGGSYIIKQHPLDVCIVPSNNAYEHFDIDTIQDLDRLKGLTDFSFN